MEGAKQERKSRSLQIRYSKNDEYLIKRLKVFAVERDKSLAEVVLEAIREYMQRNGIKTMPSTTQNQSTQNQSTQGGYKV